MTSAGLAASKKAQTEKNVRAEEAIDILRKLAADVRAVGKATVLCRVLLGRHLIMIQQNELWRHTERRDYRNDPDGTPIWLGAAERTYTSWYNFLQEGFECITGLHRQTAYSAIKLAHSTTLSSLSVQELANFKRLANVLEIASAEQSGIEITPELIAHAQEMPIGVFRATHIAKSVPVTRQETTVNRVTKVLRAVATLNPNVLDAFCSVVLDSLTRSNDDPVRAIESIVGIYNSSSKVQ